MGLEQAWENLKVVIGATGINASFTEADKRIQIIKQSIFTVENELFPKQKEKENIEPAHLEDKGHP